MARHILAAVLMITATLAQASDWQLAGPVKSKRVDGLLFFDAASVDHSSPTKVRVWAKALSTKAMDRYWNKHQKDITTQAADKIVHYYAPSYMRLERVMNQYKDPKAYTADAGLLTGYELIANTNAVPPAVMFLFEIDCSGKRYRALSLTTFTPSGDLDNTTTTPNTPYNFIAPDTNAEGLMHMLCPTR